MLVLKEAIPDGGGLVRAPGRRLLKMANLKMATYSSRRAAAWATLVSFSFACQPALPPLAQPERPPISSGTAIYLALCSRVAVRHFPDDLDGRRLRSICRGEAAPQASAPAAIHALHSRRGAIIGAIDTVLDPTFGQADPTARAALAQAPHPAKKFLGDMMPLHDQAHSRRVSHQVAGWLDEVGEPSLLQAIVDVDADVWAPLAAVAPTLMAASVGALWQVLDAPAEQRQALLATLATAMSGLRAHLEAAAPASGKAAADGDAGATGTARDAAIFPGSATAFAGDLPEAVADALAHMLNIWAAQQGEVTSEAWAASMAAVDNDDATRALEAGWALMLQGSEGLGAREAASLLAQLAGDEARRARLAALMQQPEPSMAIAAFIQWLRYSDSLGFAPKTPNLPSIEPVDGARYLTHGVVQDVLHLSVPASYDPQAPFGRRSLWTRLLEMMHDTKNASLTNVPLSKIRLINGQHNLDFRYDAGELFHIPDLMKLFLSTLAGQGYFDMCLAERPASPTTSSSEEVEESLSSDDENEDDDEIESSDEASVVLDDATFSKLTDGDYGGPRSTLAAGRAASEDSCTAVSDMSEARRLFLNEVENHLYFAVYMPGLDQTLGTCGRPLGEVFVEENYRSALGFSRGTIVPIAIELEAGRNFCRAMNAQSAAHALVRFRLDVPAMVRMLLVDVQPEEIIGVSPRSMFEPPQLGGQPFSAERADAIVALEVPGMLEGLSALIGAVLGPEPEESGQVDDGHLQAGLSLASRLLDATYRHWHGEGGVALAALEPILAHWLPILLVGKSEPTGAQVDAALQPALAAWHAAQAWWLGRPDSPLTATIGSVVKALLPSLKAQLNPQLARDLLSLVHQVGAAVEAQPAPVTGSQLQRLAHDLVRAHAGHEVDSPLVAAALPPVMAFLAAHQELVDALLKEAFDALASSPVKDLSLADVKNLVELFAPPQVAQVIADICAQPAGEAMFAHLLERLKTVPTSVWMQLAQAPPHDLIAALRRPAIRWLDPDDGFLAHAATFAAALHQVDQDAYVPKLAHQLARTDVGEQPLAVLGEALLQVNRYDPHATTSPTATDLSLVLMRVVDFLRDDRHGLQRLLDIIEHRNN